ncbi:MAG: NAD(P)-dependent oxidoreductase [Kiritimatiellia bacterium]
MNIVAFLVNRHVAEFSFSEAAAQRLRDRLPGATVVVCRTEAAFLKALPDADVALVWTFQQAWFDLAPRLKVLSTPAAGRDYFQVEPPASVSLQYGAFHGLIMGETAVALVLGATRGVIQNAAAMTSADGGWPRRRFSGHVGTVRGAHVVILGFGAIGRHVGRLLKPFGCRITGIRRRPEGDRPDWLDGDDRVVAAAELDAVLPTADHLLCILPSGPETDRLIARRRLALLPPSAFIYNLGRGNVLDEAALAAALAQGRLAGAFLDVFAEEPLAAESPLREAPNAFLYPHVSAVAPAYMLHYVDELALVLEAGG